MENPIKMDDLGVPLFLETSISLEPAPSTPFELPENSPESKGKGEWLTWTNGGFYGEWVASINGRKWKKKGNPKRVLT